MDEEKRNDGEKREANENQKAGSLIKKIPEKGAGDECAQEPSGAAAYLQNAKQEYEKNGFAVKQDPRIPTGGGHTEDEYFALPDDLRVELIDGVFYAMASPARKHQTVAVEIIRQLWDCIEQNKKECFAYIAPSDVALGEDKKTVVQPDVYLHCDLEKDKEPGPYRGAPDFAIEVLSPSNPENDLWRKRELYKRYGVREYWIVNPEGFTVYVFDFEKKESEEDTPEKYTFNDTVPVKISNGICAVDFYKVYSKIEHFID